MDKNIEGIKGEELSEKLKELGLTDVKTTPNKLTAQQIEEFKTKIEAMFKATSKIVKKPISAAERKKKTKKAKAKRRATNKSRTKNR